MLRLSIIFIALVINATDTYGYTTEGTWVNIII